MGAENSSDHSKTKKKMPKKQKIGTKIKILKRVNENRTNHAAKIPLNWALKGRKSICKIICEGNNGKIEGTGFFIMSNHVKFLITNYHNLNENQINKIINIEIYTKNK